MDLAANSALWFLPFVIPIALYTAFSDLRTMKIPNYAVIALVVVYVVVGPIALPLADYLWGYAALVIVLLFGFILSLARAIGAGDAKFIAAAAPFIAFGDILVILTILTANLLGTFATHRIVKYTPPLRNMAADWKSWNTGAKFPMGFALASSLVFYLSLAIVFGR
ncbi:prepilin peptidase [Parasulfitobacter algicola]|uniref:Prepilin peptidase n=1 Tax=Parasulfitobacter algicola TaxID=2614809 RepID=A0ABX2ITY1_9RHOB|nr:prepilin peptidase [Sulfitobacter algicola]NSX56010.1 prepilin peptidase [Sulfitobacter algicola]